MNKETFDTIRKFYSAEYDIEKILERKGLSLDDINEVLQPLDSLREQLLRIGKYTVEEEYINKDTYLQEPYERVERYIRLNVIYEYENGMTLCETTSGLFYLIPKSHLAEY